MFARKSSKQSTSINIQQNSSDFALSACPNMPHVVDPCPLSGAPTHPTWTRHPYHPWRMAFSHSNLPNPGKALVKNLNFNNFNEKNTPRGGFAFARAGGCDDLNHLRFAPVWIVWVVWIASRSVSISQHLPKGREVRLIGLGLTNFTMFKTDQNR